MQTASLGATCGFPGSVHCLMFLEVINTQSELQNIFGFLGHVIYLKCGKSVGGRWNSPEMASFWHMEDSDSDISQVHGLLQICSSWDNLTVFKEEKRVSVPFPSCQLVILFCCTSRELMEDVEHLDFPRKCSCLPWKKHCAQSFNWHLLIWTCSVNEVRIAVSEDANPALLADLTLIYII